LTFVAASILIEYLVNASLNFYRAKHQATVIFWIFEAFSIYYLPRTVTMLRSKVGVIKIFFGWLLALITSNMAAHLISKVS